MEPKHTDLQRLAQDYFLRDLTPEEAAKLEAGLSSDPSLREHLVRLSRDEWLLHRVHGVPGDNVVPIPSGPRYPTKWIALAACLALLLGIAGFFLLQSAHKDTVASSDPVDNLKLEVAELFVLEGDAITTVNEGKVRVIGEGSQMTSGDRIMTPPSARLALRFSGEETTLRLGGNTTLEISDEAGAKHLRLQQGQLFVEVATQPTNKAMRVTTDDAEAIVLGTAFEIRAGEKTHLAVIRGRVQFRSFVETEPVMVGGGYMAEASRTPNWVVEPFRTARFTPTHDRTLNSVGDVEEYITVDPDRRLMGFMTFNLGAIEGEIREARLRLRVMQRVSDSGGEGNVRLFRTDLNPDWSTGVPAPRVQISHYRGQVGAGMDLEFNIPPDQISEGVLPLLLTLDRKGNDFWFSSSEGEFAPELMLRIVPERQ